MGPFKHLTCGIMLGLGAYATTKKADMALACVAGAVMSDADHLIEYAKYCYDFGVKPSFKEWSSGKYFDKKGTVYVIFHSWEMCILLWLNAKRCDIVKGLSIGYTSHMVLDQIGNNLNWCAYFELYRIIKKNMQSELIE